MAIGESTQSPEFLVWQLPREQQARRLCRRHAGPLLTIAWIILGDIDAASEVVSDTVAAASASPAGDAASHHADARARLARSVYRRCLGRLALQERFLLPPLHRQGDTVGAMFPPLAALNLTQRAMVALMVFGDHDLARMAATLNVPAATVMARTRDILDRFADVRGAVSDATTPTALDQVHREVAGLTGRACSHRSGR